MIKHYLKIAIRSIWMDKKYSLVNIAGLATAIACCFLLIFWIKFELSFEDNYPENDRIYRLLTVEKRADGVKHSARMRAGIPGIVKVAFPQIEAAAYVERSELDLKTEDSDESEDGIATKIITTNEDFLRIFAMQYIEGNPQVVAKNRSGIITEEAARKFFGAESPVGKKLIYGPFTFPIDAVVRIPQNTQISFDVLSISNMVMHSESYIMLKKNAQITPDFTNRLYDFLKDSGDEKFNLVVQPIKDIHLKSPKEVAISSGYNVYGSITQIYLFALAVLLILIMAVINYVNTSISRALSRMKEVGVRKVTGANARQLIERFLFEAFILSFLSMLVALFLTVVLFPDFSTVMGNQTTLHFDFLTVIIALLVCIFITLLSGGYAAFYLSRFSPTAALRGGTDGKSKESMRKVLIGVQFFLSFSILICTCIMYRQINTMFNADTGIDKRNILILDTSLWYDVENYIQVIKKENPNILEASIASYAPYNASWGYSGVRWEGSKDEMKEIEFTQIACDHNYARTFGLEILQGEFIPPGLTWWQWADKETSYNIVINETFAKLMGEENPIGIKVTYAQWEFTGRIIGVVKDFNFKPLNEEISPLIISFDPEICSKLFIKTTGKDMQATISYISDKYQEMKPKHKNRPPIYYTVEDEYNKMYQVELRTAKILSAFSLITLVLSILGIISMVSFMVEKRTKEIAIRRINGANMWDVIKLFAQDLGKVALVAVILAIPVCYLLMHNWLQSYLYRTPLSWWIFLCVPLCIVLVTFIIVCIQIFFTARKNPVESLRNE